MDIKTLLALNGGDVPKALLTYKAMNHTEAQTDHVSGAIATFEAERIARIKSLIVNLSPIQPGSGDPSPSNIRPISGWTGVNVWRSGVNMFVLPDGTKSVAGVDYTYDGATNTLTKSGTSADVAGLNLGSIFLPSGTYTFSADFSGETGKTTRIHLRNAATNTNVGNISKSSPSLTVELSGTYYFRVATNGGLTGGVISNFQLERSQSQTEYVANQGKAYSVPFAPKPGTVYGGTLDVITGALTVTKSFIASYNGELLSGSWISDRDVYSAGSVPTIGAQVVYNLDEALTYSVAHPKINTLVGLNQVWSDAGAVDVTYYI